MNLFKKKRKWTQKQKNIGAVAAFFLIALLGGGIIALRHHAKVAVAGLSRVEEMRGGARAGECGGDLAGDMARLSHARDDDPPLRRHQQAHSLRKVPVQHFGQQLQRPGFAADHPLAGGKKISG